MRNVKFPLIKEERSNKILYPDNVDLFRNTKIIGDVIHAEYLGTDSSLEASDEVLKYVRPIIKTRYFMMRFESSDRDKIRMSEDSKILDYYEELKAENFVDVSSDILSKAVTYLIDTLHLVTPKNVILADGADWEI